MHQSKLIDSLNRTFDLFAGRITRIFTIDGLRVDNLDGLFQHRVFILVSGEDPFFNIRYNVNALPKPGIASLGGTTHHNDLMSFIRYPKQKDFQLKDRDEDYVPPPFRKPLEKNVGGGSDATIVLVPKTPLPPPLPKPTAIPKVANSVIRVPKAAVTEIAPPQPVMKEKSIVEIKEEIIPEVIQGNQLKKSQNLNESYDFI